MGKTYEESAEEFADSLTDLTKEGYHSELEPFDVFKKRIKAEVLNKLSQYRDEMKRGYELILENLRNSGEDTSELRLNDENIKTLEDTESLRKLFDEGKTYHDILNISDEALLKMYHVAEKAFENKQYQDSICVLRYITTLNPYISSFWTALGFSLEANHEGQQALLAYEIAICFDYTNIQHYVRAAQCALALNDTEEVRKLFEAAKEIAIAEHNASLEKEAESYLLNIKR